MYPDHVDRERAEPRQQQPQQQQQRPPSQYQHRSFGNFGDHVDKETSKPQGRVRKIVRRYQLFNRCTHSLVYILGEDVAANGKPDGKYGEYGE